MDSKNAVKVGLGALAAGVLAGILLAPKSGKETREEAVDIFEKIKDDLVSKVGSLRKLTKDTYDKTVKEVVETYIETKRITPQEAQEIKDILSESFKKIEKSLKKTTKDAKKNIAKNTAKKKK